MPLILNNKTFFWTAEACHLAGTSKNTFLRWVREGRFSDTEFRDRRGWRLFSEDELDALKTEVNRINTNTHHHTS
jgi:excisionase family DNA binding protein